MNNVYDEPYSWWRYRIDRKKVYLLIAVASMMTASCAMILITYKNRNHVCNTRQCVRASNDIFNYVNNSVRPCQNFKEFICTRPNNLESMPVSLPNRVKMQLSSIMGEEELHDDPQYLNVVKNFYRSCINERHIKEVSGLKRIRAYLKDIGGWPTVEGFTWRQNTYNWISAVHKLRAIGFEFQGIIDISVVVNKKDPKKYVLQISAPHFSQYNIDLAYNNNAIVDLAVAFGAGRDLAQKDLADITKFKDELLQISDHKQLYQINYLTVTKLQQLFPTIPWFEYLNGVLHPSATITYDEEVMVLEPDYLAGLESILKQTSSRTLANFIAWSLVEKYGPAISEPVANLMLNPLQRWEICSILAEERFREALSAAYLRRYFSAELKAKISSFWNVLKDQAFETIDSLKWMDSSSKYVAGKKLNYLVEYIGGIQGPSIEYLINDLYEPIVLGHEEFLDDLLTVDLVNVNSKYEKLHRLTSDHNWNNTIFATDLEIEYRIDSNSLILPAAALQDVYFHPDRPQYMNYGSLGFEVARKLSRLFIYGNLVNEHRKVQKWWTPFTTVNYNQYVRCFGITSLDINQDRAKYVPAESIADLAGATISYGAYARWVKMNGAEPSLPALNYTPNQLFWMSLGQSVCPESGAEGEVAEGPSGIQLLSALRNSHQFAEDFNCPIGSPMNPAEKCDMFF